MADHEEPFSGGLVTVRDPAALGPGELVQADNAYYVPYDPAIYKAKLRTKYNAAALGAAGNVLGLRYMEFDSGAKLLAAQEGTSIALSSLIAETGTYGTLAPITGVGAGKSLDVVQYNDKYVTLNGIGENQLVRSDGTFRKHGMYPVPQVDTQPTIGSGVWSDALGTGFYFFLYTEVFVDSVTGETVESAFTGTPVTAATGITNTATQAYTITKNATNANTNATKWRIYMAGPQDFETPVPNLNLFRLVAEVAIGTTTYTVGDLAATQGKYPGTVSVSAWDSGTNFVGAQDNVGNTTSANLSTLLATNFGFSGLTGAITGFRVDLRLRLTNWQAFMDQPQLRLDLTQNAGANLFPNDGSRTIPLLAIPGVAGGYQFVHGGGSTDLWGRTGAPAWPLTDVNGNANFGVRLRYETARVGFPGGLPKLDVDYIKIAVYTTGSTQPVDLSGQPYCVVNISVAGITTTFPADGMPPIASTGDIFEDQMVLNDSTDQSMIRYSIPSKPESFPSVYFVNFETKVEDKVTLIRRLGNKLIVGTSRQLYRMNYLPRETDAEYDRGRAYESIDEGDGIVGPMAACLFSPDGDSLFLAYISHTGPKMTDGFQSKPLNTDLDWENTVRIPNAGDVNEYLNTSLLVDYPAKQQLWFYYTAPGSTTNNRAIVFHYDNLHRKFESTQYSAAAGTCRATGPITVAALSATSARLAGYDLLVTGQSGGFTYIEDRGYTDASGGNPLFAVKTREMYLAGVGQQATVEKIYTRHRQDATSTVTVTVFARRKDQAQFSSATKTFDTSQAGTSENPIHIGADSHQFKFEEIGNSGFGIRLTGFTLDTGGTGKTVART